MFSKLLPILFILFSQLLFAQQTTSPRTYAMIMGISNYKYIRPLAYADSDAELFRDFLKSPGGGNVPDSCIYFLKNEDARQASFWLQGMSWLEKRNLVEGDRLYIYLAGHGDAINEDEFFFLAYDCNPANDKNNYILTGTIQLYNLKSRISRQIRKGVQVIFIMDACRTNELPGGDEGQKILRTAISEKRVGEIMMLATSAGQESLEDASIGTGHGLFTYYLVDGLSGLADSFKTDQSITLAELQNYVGNTVSALASDKYKKKQEPFFCCEKDMRLEIARVDTGFLRQWKLAKHIKEQLYGSEIDAIARNTRARSITETSDSSVIELYNRFTAAVKQLNLVKDESSAEKIFDQLVQIAPKDPITDDARITLAAEFINLAQARINLYLQGRDVSSIQRIRSQLDDEDRSEEVDNSLDRMEKVARQEFSEIARMLQKAISMLNLHDESFLRSLKAKYFFFRANGYHDRKDGDKITLEEAISFARTANASDPGKAYILNTLATLMLDDNKADSTLFFASGAIRSAPNWRYPYLNMAHAWAKKNNRDSALKFYRLSLQVDPTSADAHVDLGHYFSQLRKNDSARHYYQLALRIDPSHVPANNNMGWIYRESREYDKALQAFRIAINNDPAFFNAYNGISRVFSDTRQYDSARLYYHKAMTNYPDKLIAVNYLGRFYQDLEQLDSASKYFRQAAIYDPNYDAPFINLGKLFAAQQKFDSARYYYLRAIDLNSKNFRGFNQMGLMFQQMKQFDSARIYLRRAMAVNPGNTTVLNNLGLSFSEQKSPDSAIMYFRRVLELDPGNAYAFNNLGVTFMDMKRIDSARRYYQLALEYMPHLNSSMINLGLLARQENNFDEAKYFFRKVVDVNPANTVALNHLENLFKQEHQYDSAIYYYKQAMGRGVNNSFVFNNLGRLYFDTEKFDSAMRFYMRAIEVDSNNSAAFNNLGFVFSNLSQNDSALVYLQKAFMKDSVNALAAYNLGVVFNRMNQNDSSIRYLMRSLQVEPRNVAAYFNLACSFAAAGKTEEALKYLSLALEKGYRNYEYIIVEKDLQSIRKLEGYRKLMEKYFPGRPIE